MAKLDEVGDYGENMEMSLGAEYPSWWQMTPLRGANLKESTAKNQKIKDFPDFTTPCFSKAHVMGTLELGQEKTLLKGG